MKLSITSSVAVGALAVSALHIPSDHSYAARAAAGVDLTPFKTSKVQFKTISLADAKAKVVKTPNPSSSAKAPAAAADSFRADFGSCTSPGTRVEWRNLSDDDKDGFVNSIQCLIDMSSLGGDFRGQNRFENLIWVHQQMTGSIHMVGQFLPWHRYFLWVFESMLRFECGYRGPMTWWDETRDAGNFRSAPLFTDRWFGAAPEITPSGDGTCIGNGRFGGLTLHVGPGGDFTDHCLSRAINETLSSECNADFVNTCNSNGNYGDMEPCSEMGPHAFGHLGVGAIMSDVAPSPGDPVFYMHHGFIDRNWANWQAADYGNRLYQIGGYTTTEDPKKPLTLDYVLTSRGLRPDVTVRDVMDTAGNYLCYRYEY